MKKNHIIKLAVSLLTVLTVLPSSAQEWSLEQCIDTALANNKSVLIGLNNEAVARERQAETRANYIPKLNLSGDYKYYIEQPTQLMPTALFGGPPGTYREVQFGVPHNIGANLILAAPVYNPQLAGARKMADLATDLTAIQLQKTREQIIYEVTNYYYNAQILRNQLSFIDSNLININKLLGNMELLYEQWMAKGSDVDKIRLQRDQLVTQRDIAGNDYEQILSMLKFLMGIDQSRNIEVPGTIGYTLSQTTTPNTNVDIRLAEGRRDQIGLELEQLKRSKLPTLSVMGSYGQVGYGQHEEPNTFLDFYPVSFLGLQFSMPVFNGTVTQRKINQKSLEYENSRLELDLANERVSVQCASLRRKVETAIQNIENTQLQVKLADRIYKQTLLQQREGTATLTEVLLADNSLREAQQKYLAAVIDYLKSELELKKLNGSLTNFQQ